MNRGAQDLEGKLDKLGHGARMALARRMGVGPDRISHWLKGRGKPNTAQRVAIEDAHGTPLLSWDEEIEEHHEGAA